MLWIIQNHERAPAGQYETRLNELGYGHQTVKLHHGATLPELTSGDRVLVLGGAMGYDQIDQFPWLHNLKHFLLAATESDTPLFCICLGAQLLTDALGGTVTRNHNQERGISRIHLSEAGRHDPLMTDIPTTFPAMQWHNDSFELPPQATLLASSFTCPVQLFRYRNAYGTQFHPEVNQLIINTWNATLEPPGDYDKEFALARSDWHPFWDRLLTNFLSLTN